MLFSLLFFVGATHAVRLAQGYNSRCFESAFDANYANPSSRGRRSVAVTIVIEERYRDIVTPRMVQATFDTANRLWARAGVFFGDLQFQYASSAAIGYAPGQTSDFFDRMKANWWAEARKYPGRMTMIFSQVRTLSSSSSFAGVHINGVGSMVSRKDQYLWMNVDGFNNGGRGGWYTDRTLQHELGHAIGLFHTFQDSFGCRENDYVDDTSITPKILGGGCGTRASGCDGQSVVRDTENLMSYGSCNGAKAVTEGQMRRVRCAMENHIPWRPIGSATRSAPSPAPTPAGVPRGVGTQCLGTGTCVDTSRANACAHQLFSGACPGSSAIKCCKDMGSIPTATPTPPPPGAESGVGSRCLRDRRGVCFDSNTHRCPGQVYDACPGRSNIVCCTNDPRKRSVEADGESSDLITNKPEEEIRDADMFPTPNPNDVYHIGDTITVEVSIVLVNAKVHLVRRNDVVLKIEPQELVSPGVVAGAAQDSTNLYKFTIPLNAIERGSYAIVITGTEVEEDNTVVGPRTLVSEVFYVDVNSCPVDAKVFGVPYGLVRLESECSEREGRVSHKLDNGLVCCAPEITTTPVTKPAEVDASDIEEIDGLDEAVLLPAEIIVGNFTRVGYTSFWGVPMTISPMSKTDFSVALIEAGSDADIVGNVPSAVFTSSANAKPQTFTPKIAAPTAVAFATQDLVAQSPPFSVVSLPCRLTTGQAGYCRPTSAITNNLGERTPEELVCSNGQAAQCAGLKVGSTSFACCPGSASALQKAASYRAELGMLDTSDLDSAPQGESSASTNGLVLTTGLFAAIVSQY